MITGAVTADREAVIRLAVRGRAGQEQQIEDLLQKEYDQDVKKAAEQALRKLRRASGILQ